MCVGLRKAQRLDFPLDCGGRGLALCYYVGVR